MLMHAHTGRLCRPSRLSRPSSEPTQAQVVGRRLGDADVHDPVLFGLGRACKATCLLQILKRAQVADMDTLEPDPKLPFYTNGQNGSVRTIPLGDRHIQTVLTERLRLF